VRTAATALTTTTHAGDLVDLAGYVADTGPAQQLSEIGIILLTFGVGIHFSVGDLLSVRRITVPGAAVQIALATALGAVVVGVAVVGERELSVGRHEVPNADVAQDECGPTAAPRETRRQPTGLLLLRRLSRAQAPVGWSSPARSPLSIGTA
jgi:hypothetical protein